MNKSPKMFTVFVIFTKKGEIIGVHSKKERIFKMKKIICMLAAVMILFTACGNRDTEKGTENGVVQDGDGIIEENNGADENDSVIDDAADGAEDIVDGATDAVDDAAKGVENATDDMTDSRMRRR